MSGVLLDSHTLYWLVSGERKLSEESLIAIGESQDAGTLFVSPITAWELSIATQKHRAAGRPHLGEDPPAKWFREAVSVTSARIVSIHARIACEAAKVATDTGHKDPGDCFLIATARVKRLLLITTDTIILGIAADRPDYLGVISC